MSCRRVINFSSTTDSRSNHVVRGIVRLRISSILKNYPTGIDHTTLLIRLAAHEHNEIEYRNVYTTREHNNGDRTLAVSAIDHNHWFIYIYMYCQITIDTIATLILTYFYVMIYRNRETVICLPTRFNNSSSVLLTIPIYLQPFTVQSSISMYDSMSCGDWSVSLTDVTLTYRRNAIFEIPFVQRCACVCTSSRPSTGNHLHVAIAGECAVHGDATHSIATKNNSWN